MAIVIITFSIVTFVLAMGLDMHKKRIEDLEEKNRELQLRCDNIAELYRKLCKDLLK